MPEKPKVEQPRVDISSIEMVLLWDALREYRDKTVDAVASKDCETLLKKLGCTRMHLPKDSVASHAPPPAPEPTALAETIRKEVYDYWFHSKKHFGQTHMQDLLRGKIVELLRAAPAAAQGAPDGWISVDEKYPPRHQDVLCFNRDGDVFRGRICMGMHKPFFTYPRGFGDASNTAPDWIDVTHWMALPSSPVSRKED